MQPSDATNILKMPEDASLNSPIYLKRNKNRIQKFLGSPKALTTEMSCFNYQVASPQWARRCFSPNPPPLISIQQTHRDGKKQRHLSSLTACSSSRLPSKASLRFILKARPGSLGGSQRLSRNTYSLHVSVGHGRPAETVVVPTLSKNVFPFCFIFLSSFPAPSLPSSHSSILPHVYTDATLLPLPPIEVTPLELVPGSRGGTYHPESD